MKRGWLPKAALLTGTGTVVVSASLIFRQDNRASDERSRDAAMKNTPERLDIPAVQFAAPKVKDRPTPDTVKAPRPSSAANPKVRHTHRAQPAATSSTPKIDVDRAQQPATVEAQSPQAPVPDRALTAASHDDEAVSRTSCAPSCASNPAEPPTRTDSAESPSDPAAKTRPISGEAPEHAPIESQPEPAGRSFTSLPVPAFGVADITLPEDTTLRTDRSSASALRMPGAPAEGEPESGIQSQVETSSLQVHGALAEFDATRPDRKSEQVSAVAPLSGREASTYPPETGTSRPVPTAQVSPETEQRPASDLVDSEAKSAQELVADRNTRHSFDLARSGRQPAKPASPDPASPLAHRGADDLLDSSLDSPPPAERAHGGGPEPLTTVGRPLPVPLFGQTQSSADRPIATDASSPGNYREMLRSPGPIRHLSAPTAKSAQAELGAGLLTGAAPHFTESDELIVSLRTSSGEIDETISAFGTRQGVFVPLGELSRIFDLALRISDEGHYASGWIIDPARTLSLNLRALEGVVGDKTTLLSPGQFVAYQDDIFVRTDALEVILPIAVKVDLRDQAIIITPLEKLPFQARLEREAERQRLASRSGRSQKEAIPLDPAPWSALSMPIGDVELRAVTDDTFGKRLELEMRAAADFAFLTARGFLEATSRDGVTGVRLELGRRDPAARLLGPLRATQFALGDIATLSQAVGLRSVAGRGLFISNAPLDETSVFDRIDLRGPLPDGYEVELYRNNVLIGASASAVNGQYEFLQVPLDFGANVLRLVFYGPQGQTREEVRRFTVGSGRLAAGDLVYDLGLVQKDRPLIPVRPPLYLANASEGQWRAAGNFAYGLSNRITVAGGLALAWNRLGNVPGIGGNLGLRSELAGLPYRLDVALQQGGATALRAAAATRVGAFGIALSHSEYRRGFIDEVQAFDDAPLHRATSLDINGALPLGSAGLPFIGRLARLAYADGRVIETASLRTSLRLGNALLSPALEYNATSGPLATSSHLAANFDLALFAGSRTRIRASTTLDLSMGPSVSQVSAQVDRSLSERNTARLFASHSFSARQSQIGGSFSHRFDRASLALDASTSFPNRAHYIGLRLSAGFLQNPFSRQMQLAMPGISTGGLLAIRTYRDENANGIEDAGDTPVAGIGVLAAGKTYETGHDGVALVTALGDGVRANYGIDEATLPDIALAPVRTGGAFVARPGRIQRADLGIVALSDIEGQAVFAGSSSLKGVSGLQLVLTDANGTAIARTRSQTGGSFLFERIPPGRYTLAIAEDQAERLGIELLTPVLIDVSGKSDQIRVDLHVHQSRPASAS